VTWGVTVPVYQGIRAESPGGAEALPTPHLGRLDLEFTSFQVADQPSLRLYLYTPADDGRTEAKLRETVTAAKTRA